MNKGPSKWPTSSEIPTPSLYQGCYRGEGRKHCINNANYAEHILQKLMSECIW